jgi:hypothetical protein
MHVANSLPAGGAHTPAVQPEPSCEGAAHVAPALKVGAGAELILPVPVHVPCWATAVDA